MIKRCRFCTGAGRKRLAHRGHRRGQRTAGFCKVDLHGDGTGKLDYLVVLPQCRGRKYGKALMDWAMAVFSGSGVRKIEVKVVDGNDAVHLYEKYGFRMNAHILVRGE